MVLISNQMIIILLIYGQCIFKMIEMNKIGLVWIVITGQVIDKVMMDIHKKIRMVIILEVVKIVLSEQQQLSFMELIHKQILNNILILKV